VQHQTIWFVSVYKHSAIVKSSSRNAFLFSRELSIELSITLSACFFVPFNWSYQSTRRSVDAATLCFFSTDENEAQWASEWGCRGGKASLDLEI